MTSSSTSSLIVLYVSVFVCWSIRVPLLLSLTGKFITKAMTQPLTAVKENFNETSYASSKGTFFSFMLLVFLFPRTFSLMGYVPTLKQASIVIVGKKLSCNRFSSSFTFVSR